jgi:NADH dehydrogenase (ubiquinone) 1 alpha subcomplex subunit 6
VDIYQLNISSTQIRHKIREEFEKNRHVVDLATIDILLFKSRTEYEETMNLWKQKTHIMRYFVPSVVGPKDFMQDFYLGKE